MMLHTRTFVVLGIAALLLAMFLARPSPTPRPQPPKDLVEVPSTHIQQLQDSSHHPPSPEPATERSRELLPWLQRNFQTAITTKLPTCPSSVADLQQQAVLDVFPGALIAPPSASHLYQVTQMVGLIGRQEEWHHTSGEPAMLEDPSASAEPVICADEATAQDGEEQPWFGFNNYRANLKFAGGAHGEVWRAVRFNSGNSSSSGEGDSSSDDTEGDAERGYVLKRIFVEKGQAVLMSGLREVHFGEKLRGSDHVARFVESFNISRSCGASTPQAACRDGLVVVELWLVFRDEGASLQRFLYSHTPIAGGSTTVQPSPFWHKMKTDKAGGRVLRQMVRQMLAGLRELQAAGVVHRDVKPANMLISLSPPQQQASRPASLPVVKLADFGSALDDFVLRELWNSTADPAADETNEYRPPEAVLRLSDATPSHAYDVWSVGVVMLEMILGRKDVFYVAPKAHALLERKLRDAPHAVRQQAGFLSALSEYCIYSEEHALMLKQHQQRWTKHAHNSSGDAPSVCGLTAFNATLVHRDPYHVGTRDAWATRLLWRMLQWDPATRITASEALTHAYFEGPHACDECGMQFELASELHRHRRRHAERSRVPISSRIAGAGGGAGHDHSHGESVAQLSMLDDRVGDLKFNCSHCGRAFDTLQGCEMHQASRRGRHGELCEFHTSSLPPCTSNDNDTRSGEARSGYCGLRSRRLYMEDMNNRTVLAVPTGDEEEGEEVEVHMWAVYDGHLGSEAASYCRRWFPQVLTQVLARVDDVPRDKLRAWLTRQVRQAFWTVGYRFKRHNPGSKAGATATVALLLPALHEGATPLLVVGNVGDSRAVACCGEEGELLQLTTDHTAKSEVEQANVAARGGFVEFNGVWRVQGELAVTRSIGDIPLQHYLSTTADVTITEVQPSLRTLVIATDGMWDVVSSERALQQARLHLRHDWVEEHEPTAAERVRRAQAAAAGLAYEAYVRGSSDNIGVHVVDLTDS